MPEWKDTVNLPRTGFPMKANLQTAEPEALARWQAERVASLRPGAVDMALQLAAELDDARDPRPVWIVPIVWRVVFAVDAAPGLIEHVRTVFVRITDDLTADTDQFTLNEFLLYDPRMGFNIGC